MKKRLLLAAFGLLLMLVSNPMHAQNIKMKIPSITGMPADGEDIIAFETSDTAFRNIIGGGSGQGKTEFEYVKVKKQYGASTNDLWKHSLNGTHYPAVVFEFYNSSNTLFYKITLNEVFVSHFSYLAPECTSCPRMFHQVWFDYKAIEVKDMITGNTVSYNRATTEVN